MPICSSDLFDFTRCGGGQLGGEGVYQSLYGDTEDRHGLEADIGPRLEDGKMGRRRVQELESHVGKRRRSLSSDTV
jgi:hypothetical protein